jgi:hypothetical protein
MYGLKNTMCQWDWMATDGRCMEVGQRLDASQTNVGQNSDGRQMEVRRMFNGSQTDTHYVERQYGRMIRLQDSRTVGHIMAE